MQRSQAFFGAMNNGALRELGTQKMRQTLRNALGLVLFQVLPSAFMTFLTMFELLDLWFRRL